MTSWVWLSSGSWWWTGTPGVLESMGSQRVRHDWATELNWTELGHVDYITVSLTRDQTQAPSHWEPKVLAIEPPGNPLALFFFKSWRLAHCLLWLCQDYVQQRRHVTGGNSSRGCFQVLWVRKIPWRRKWLSTPALLPGKSHGWRILIGYSPWGRKESDTTEWLHFQLFSWGGQSTGASALASFLPKKSQGWSPSEWTGWISLQSMGLSRIFSNTTVQKHQFFGAQLSSQSNSHIHTWPQEKP